MINIKGELISNTKSIEKLKPYVKEFVKFVKEQEINVLKIQNNDE